jgi:hypothetical protein
MMSFKATFLTEMFPRWTALGLIAVVVVSNGCVVSSLKVNEFSGNVTSSFTSGAQMGNVFLVRAEWSTE